jgi:hypothetical protein
MRLNEVLDHILLFELIEMHEDGSAFVSGGWREALYTVESTEYEYLQSLDYEDLEEMVWMIEHDAAYPWRAAFFAFGIYNPSLDRDWSVKHG